MLGVSSPALDLSAILQFACTTLALIIATLFVVRKTASRYFVVDAGFEGNEFQSGHSMLVGGREAGSAGVSECPACDRPASKRCSRCKSVWYCSELCQSKHWKEDHKLKCRVSSEKFDIRRTVSRRKSSVISLIPDLGTLKVLKEPKKILFPYDEFVKLFDWHKPGFPPCGLLNCGNSCFANVILQCLASTRPLFAYLLEKDHNRGCLRRRDDWCFLCELQVHIKRCYQSSQPFSPINILSRLPNIGGNLGYGRQEDAHEFMRFAIDTMQSICLDEFGGEKLVDLSVQETTFVQYIFGGHLQSQVICTNCDAISNRYENMMDLTVEIHGDSESVEECLDQFTVKEWLDGDNMYKCDGCNSYVKAWKRLTVHQAPNVLTIALKRFQSGRFGKLNKRVTFPEKLDLSPYMSASGDGADRYILYGVILHLDMLNASFFGHYICYTKDYQGLWYRIDDCKVVKVEVEEVLAQNAYMLLYHRRNPRKDPFIKLLDSSAKLHSAEVDPEISKTRNSPKSSVCTIFSTSGTPELQSETLNSELLSNFALKEAGHERQLQESIINEPDNIILDASAAASAYPVPVFDDDFNADGSGDMEPENRNLFESTSNSIVLPPEIESSECQEFRSFFSADLHIEECKDSISDEMIFEPKVLENGIKAPSTSLKLEKRKKGSENGSMTKVKPIFTPGFLDKPAVKKPVICEKTSQMEDHGAYLFSKVNGYINGHFPIKSAVSLDNENDEKHANPLVSDTAYLPNGFVKVNCNGKSSYYENALKERGIEQPFSNSQIHAENNSLSCNSDAPEIVNCSPTRISKIAECHRDMNQSSGQSNWLYSAHLSD